MVQGLGVMERHGDVGGDRKGALSLESSTQHFIKEKREVTGQGEYKGNGQSGFHDQ